MKLRTLGSLAALALVLSGCGQSSSSTSASSTGALTAPATDINITSPEAKAALAALPPPYNQADLANGETHFSLCRSCHTIVKGGANMTGPNLSGVFGRPAAGKPDYAYSDALKAKGLTWTPATLDQWLSGPQTFVPGTKMSFVGIKDDKDRRDVIAYVALASAAGSAAQKQ